MSHRSRGPRAIGALFVAALAASSSTAHAQLPGLPEVQDLSVFVTAATPIDWGGPLTQHGWQDGRTVGGFGFELGWLAHNVFDENKQNTFAQAFSGFVASSLRGDIDDNLRARASMREVYFGGGVQHNFTRLFGIYASANARLVTLASGRVYGTDNPVRPAYKLAGDGIGVAVNAGVTFGNYCFIELNLTSRYLPSIVVEPPSGVTGLPSLPANVPERMSFHTVGISFGANFDFTKKSDPPKPPACVCCNCPTKP